MREIEASLVICSDNSERIAKQIAQLDSIADHTLVSTGSKKIVDTYFDTSDRILEKRRVALRIREIDGNYWITVKGSSQDGIPNVDRLEKEVKWSHDNITRIIDYLKNIASIEGLRAGKRNFSDAKPIEMLQETGFVIVQRRENFREMRNILSRNSKHQDSPVLAEVDIDHVIYHFNSTDLSLYDIEIEEKTSGKVARKDKDTISNSILDTIVEELISRYGPDTFKKWNYGKLALGKGIAKLLKDNILKDMVDRDNNLKREAYVKIEEYIQHAEV
jgi:hypothetical protein